MEAPKVATLKVSINEALSRYLKSQDISALKHIEELQRYAAAAEELLQATNSLSSEGQKAVRSNAGVHTPIPTAPALRTLVRATKVAESRASKPRRGPHRKDSFRQLIAELGILWAVERPATKGIGKIHGKPTGQMLEFIHRVLDAHARKALKVGGRSEALAFRVQSKDALGEMLYALRKKIAQGARTDQEHQTAAGQIGTTEIFACGSADNTIVPSMPRVAKVAA